MRGPRVRLAQRAVLALGGAAAAFALLASVPPGIDPEYARFLEAARRPLFRVAVEGGRRLLIQDPAPWQDDQDQRLELEKPPGTRRVLVAGESSADELGAEMRRALADSSKVEVLNCSVPGGDLRMALRRLRECMGYSPDAVVFQFGHNLYYSHPDAPAPLLGAALKIRRLRGDPSRFPDGADRLPVLKQALEEVAGLAARRKIPLVLATVPANLFVYPKADPRDASDADYLQADYDFETGRRSAAIAKLEAASSRRASALWQFRLGEWLWREGRWPEAAARLRRARDLDLERNRASSAVNDLIREAARRNGAILLDAEALISGQAPHGLPGWESFIDGQHVQRRLFRELALRCADALSLGLSDPHPLPPRDDAPLTPQRLRDVFVIDPWPQTSWETFAFFAAANLWRLPASPSALLESAFPDPQDRAAAHLGLAEALWRAGRRGQALAELELAQRLAPSWAEPPLERGIWELRAGRRRRAADCYRRAASLAPEDSRARFFTSNSKGSSSDAGQAARELAASAEAALAAGEPAALASAEDALSRLEPKSGQAWLALARLLRFEGRDEEALKDLRAALRLIPEDADVQVELGRTYNDTGRFSQARASLQAAIRKRPDQTWLYVELARSELGLGRLDRAKEAFAKAKRRGRDQDSYIREGYALLAFGEKARAREEFEAVADSGSAPVGLHHLGVLQATEGRPEEAQADLARAVRALDADPRADPKERLHARLWLSSVLLKQGKTRQAEAVCRQALASAKPGDAFRAGFLSDLADALAAQGKTAEAEQLLAKIIGECDERFACSRLDRAEAIAHLAGYYADHGRRERARALADRARRAYDGLAVDNTLGRADGTARQLNALAAIYAKLGDFAAARTLYERVVSARASMPFHPQLASAETELAGLYEAEGRRSDAESLYRQALEIWRYHDDPGRIAHVLARLVELGHADGDAAPLIPVERELSALEPKTAEAWLALGRLYRYDGRYQDADFALRRAAAQGPASWEADGELGLLLNETGRYAEAADRLQTAIAKEAGHAWLYIELARSQLGLGRLDRAKEAFAEAKRLNDSDAYIREGYARLAFGESAQAQKDFETLASSESRAIGLNHLGVYEMAKGQTAQAEADLRRSLAQLEADPRSRSNDVLHVLEWLVDLLIEEGRTDEAETFCREGLRRAKGDASYLRFLLSEDLAELRAAKGRPEEAERLFREALAYCDKPFACSRLDRGQARTLLAGFYADRGRRAQARALADQAGKDYAGIGVSNPLGREDGSARYLDGLAALYAKLGEKSRAEELYARVVAARGSMPFHRRIVEAESALAGLYAADGRLGDAAALYRLAIEGWDYYGDRGQAQLARAGLEDVMKRRAP